MTNRPPRKRLLLRRREEPKTAPPAWRSLEELGSAEAVDEFAHGAQYFEQAGISRRDFVRLLGASAALAGAAACSPPTEKVLPYTRAPLEITPGIPLYFATSMVLDGHALGVLVRSHEGRPTKIEGNPDHPASLGATGVFEQAAVLGLYDPDRATGVRMGALPASFAQLSRDASEPTRGLRFLMTPQSSPTLLGLLQTVVERHPGTRFTFHSPGALDNVYAGHALGFGRPVQPHCDFARARVVLSLDADFLSCLPRNVRNARQWASARRIDRPEARSNRLYVVEAGLSTTGMSADHRLPLQASAVVFAAAALVRALLLQGRTVPGQSAGLADRLQGLAARAQAPKVAPFIEAVARDLVANAGECVVVAGELQPPEVHALALLANAALGNLGRTLTFTHPTTVEEQLPTQSLPDLAREMEAGEVQRLVIVEGNPAYTAPADLGMAALIERVPSSVHLSLHDNETSALCQWFVPAAHPLESWGDARAYDGTISFLQPLIAPMHGGRTATELAAIFVGRTRASAHELLLSHWRGQLGEQGFDEAFETHLQRGFLPETRAPRETAEPTFPGLLPALDRLLERPAQTGLELRMPLSATVYDGRFGNNVWLQELPDPATSLTWDNAALMSPDTARGLGVQNEDVVVLRVGARSLRAPVLVLPMHASDSITLALGYGRRGTERVATGVGVDAFALRTVDAPYHAPVSIERTGARYPLALTQTHFTLADRPIALLTTAEHYRAHPDFTEHERTELPTLLPAVDMSGLQWAMTIDTTICTGCTSCVIACQAENNIPVVGKTGVLRSREMHWLRIDRYYVGSPDAPEVVNQPMLCQHCEKAPCEYVCPVNATVHSPDGLNEMIYNRCVGTRFCSNNCPYKVRRFNWLDYTDESRRQLQKNPEVTVRDRGVMEKCTYCVQRIRTGEIRARRENRELAPGEIVTACQQACPTGAIQFGALAHTDTPMVRWRREPRAYNVLHHQNTRPRTMYLAKILNKNPELAE